MGGWESRIRAFRRRTDTAARPNGPAAGTYDLTPAGQDTTAAQAVARERLRALADEHVALLRVATLAARGVSSAEMFGAVAREI